MHYSKKTAAGCRIARDLLSTWPFNTDAGSSFVMSRKPYLQPQNAAPCARSSTGAPSNCASGSHRSIRSDCLVIETEAADPKHRPLTPEQKQALYDAHPPPYFLQFALS